MMGLDIFFKEDVIRILAGIRQAATQGINAAGIQTKESQEYHQGYIDALDSVATAFGVRITDNGHREPKRLREWT